MFLHMFVYPQGWVAYPFQGPDPSNQDHTPLLWDHTPLLWDHTPSGTRTPWKEHGTRQEVTLYPQKEHGTRQEVTSSPPVRATKAGSMHPTGMLSCCFFLIFTKNCIKMNEIEMSPSWIYH